MQNSHEFFFQVAYISSTLKPFSFMEYFTVFEQQCFLKNENNIYSVADSSTEKQSNRGH